MLKPIKNLFPKVAYSVVCILILTNCQSAEKKKFDSIIAHNTRSSQLYSGFHQAFEATITSLDRETTQAILEQQSRFHAWDNQTLQLETQKANDKRITESRFFLRFYSPESDYDDLHKPNSIWKIYLVLNGQKYAGKVTKDFSKFVEIQTIYPYFDRFSTGYYVTFPVGRPSVEDQSYTILLTSSLGQAEFKF